jgi:hypothetical protein
MVAIRRLKSDSRRAILKWTALAIVVSGLFPPWLYTFDRGSTSDIAGGHWEVSAGYGCLFSPPKYRVEDALEGREPIAEYDFTYKHARAGVKLDMPRLLVEWVCILTLGGTAWGLVLLNREQVSYPGEKPEEA